MADEARTVDPRRLPEVLPVFPLTGVLLLPGTVLPLNVFEPRYRHLVEDVLEGERMFGMVQPLHPRQDNRPGPGAEREVPELYPVGCAGRLRHCETTEDEHYQVELQGVHRFRIRRELPMRRGYRRVEPRYEEFPDALGPGDWRCDRGRLVERLQRYGRTHGLQIEAQQLDAIGDAELVNGLAVALPFAPAEKQALLEALTPAVREAVLLDLLHLGSAATGAAAAPPAN